MCSSDSGEGLTSEEFDFLLETVKVDSAFGQFLSKLIFLQTTEEGMVKIADVVHLLQSNY